VDDTSSLAVALRRSIGGRWDLYEVGEGPTTGRYGTEKAHRVTLSSGGVNLNEHWP